MQGEYMKYSRLWPVSVFCWAIFTLTSCATTDSNDYDYPCATAAPQPAPLLWDPSCDYSARVPQQIETHGQKVVLVDPRAHAWGAYAPSGELVKAGIATAGGDWCEDVGRPCRTTVGTFRIRSLGSADCKSSVYPLPKGGGLMPYCMFFHGSESLHGTTDDLLAEDNLSHGCVRMRIQDAEWVRYEFASVGTKVVIKPYE